MTRSPLGLDLAQLGERYRADWIRLQRTYRPSMVLMIVVTGVALVRCVQQIWFVRRLAERLSGGGDWLAYLASAMRTADSQRSYSGLELSLREGVNKAIYTLVVTVILGTCCWATKRFFLQRQKFWSYVSLLEERARAGRANTAEEEQ